MTVHRVDNRLLLARARQFLRNTNVSSPVVHQLQGRIRHLSNVLRLQCEDEELEVLARFGVTMTLQQWFEMQFGDIISTYLPKDLIARPTIPTRMLHTARPLSHAQLEPLIAAITEDLTALRKQSAELLCVFFVARDPREINVTVDNVRALFPELGLSETDARAMGLAPKNRQSGFNI